MERVSCGIHYSEIAVWTNSTTSTCAHSKIIPGVFRGTTEGFSYGISLTVICNCRWGNPPREVSFIIFTSTGSTGGYTILRRELKLLIPNLTLGGTKMIMTLSKLKLVHTPSMPLMEIRKPGVDCLISHNRVLARTPLTFRCRVEILMAV